MAAVEEVVIGVEAAVDRVSDVEAAVVAPVLVVAEEAVEAEEVVEVVEVEGVVVAAVEVAEEEVVLGAEKLLLLNRIGMRVYS